MKHYFKSKTSVRSAGTVIEAYFSGAPRSAPLEVEVVDLKGTLVKKLTIAPGSTVVSWDKRDRAGRRVRSGMYLFYVRRQPSAALPTLPE